MQTSVQVNLGGKPYLIKRLPMRAAQKWREQFLAQFNEFAGVFRDASSIEIIKTQKQAGDYTAEDLNIGGIAAALGQFSGTILGAVDVVFDLLCEYSPEIKADRERLLDNAYDEEIVSAFIEAVKLAIPFADRLPQLLKPGQPEPTTSPSSPEPSGESGTTN